MEYVPSCTTLEISAGGQTLIDGTADENGEHRSESERRRFDKCSQAA